MVYFIVTATSIFINSKRGNTIEVLLLLPWYGMVWYGMVTLFIRGISFRYIYIQVEKTNYPTKLESKIKN